MSELVSEVLRLEQRMKIIAVERDRLGAGHQSEDLEAQRQKLEEKRRALLARATDRELIALEYGREAVSHLLN